MQSTSSNLNGVSVVDERGNVTELLKTLERGAELLKRGNTSEQKGLPNLSQDNMSTMGNIPVPGSYEPCASREVALQPEENRSFCFEDSQVVLQARHCITGFSFIPY
jgi:hypothetical protein